MRARSRALALACLFLPALIAAARAQTQALPKEVITEPGDVGVELEADRYPVVTGSLNLQLQLGYARLKALDVWTDTVGVLSTYAYRF